MTFRAYLRTFDGAVSEKTITQDPSVALVAFAALVSRFELDGQKLAAALTCDSRQIAFHRFDRRPGDSEQTKRQEMSKVTLFHGGPIATEFFDGHSFWTWKLSQAVEYMDSDDDLWVIEMEKSSEVFADENDYLPTGGYSEADGSDENWEIQTSAIRSAISDGATVVMCDDGWVVVNVDRLSPRRITAEEAEELQ